MKSIAYVLTLILLAFSFNSIAQDLEVISAGGEYYESAEGSLSYTVGEVVIETVETTSNHLTQGFQQESIFVLNVVSYNNDFNVSVFPNPTTNYVNVVSSSTSTVNIYDAAGKLVHTQNVNETDKIEMQNYEDGIYQLVFIKDQKQLKTVKVLVQ